MEVNNRIFIAGTGRSGTTRLAELLGSHSNIYGIRNEARFIIDPDGLEDLIDALTTKYSVYHSDQALKRFDFMMRRTLIGLTDNAFKSWHHDKYFGREHYFLVLNTFMATLVDFDFNETVPVDRFSNPEGSYWPSEQKTYRRVIGKYFSCREEVVELCRYFIDELFSIAAIAVNKNSWCEKTPLNLLSMPFLWELFPEAKVIHIKRDPRGVAYSLTQQSWAPSNIEDALKILVPIYDRWQKLKASYPLADDRYLEIKSETFFSDCKNQSAILMTWLGEDVGDMDMENISPDRINSWQQKIKPSDLELCNAALSPYMALMGYDY